MLDTIDASLNGNQEASDAGHYDRISIGGTAHASAEQDHVDEKSDRGSAANARVRQVGQSGKSSGGQVLFSLTEVYAS